MPSFLSQIDGIFKSCGGEDGRPPQPIPRRVGSSPTPQTDPALSRQRGRSTYTELLYTRARAPTCFQTAESGQTSLAHHKTGATGTQRSCTTRPLVRHNLLMLATYIRSVCDLSAVCVYCTKRLSRRVFAVNPREHKKEASFSECCFFPLTALALIRFHLFQRLRGSHQRQGLTQETVRMMLGVRILQGHRRNHETFKTMETFSALPSQQCATIMGSIAVARMTLRVSAKQMKQRTSHVEEGNI